MADILATGVSAATYDYKVQRGTKSVSLNASLSAASSYSFSSDTIQCSIQPDVSVMIRKGADVEKEGLVEHVVALGLFPVAATLLPDDHVKVVSRRLTRGGSWVAVASGSQEVYRIVTIGAKTGIVPHLEAVLATPAAKGQGVKGGQ